MALEDVEDAVDNLLAGEVRVVGGHGPREPPHQGVRVRRRGGGGGEGERRGGGERDAAEYRRPECRRRHFVAVAWDLTRPRDGDRESEPTAHELVLGCAAVV